MITITLTWAAFKWAGLPLLILALIALFGGSLPDHDGNSFCNGLRWVTWPLFILWFVILIGRALFC